MSSWRTRLFYFVLLPAFVFAAMVLGYYTYQTAGQISQLGERSIVQSTLLLVEEKVDRVEQMIIAADNAVFHLVNLEDPGAIERDWLPNAERLSPSIRETLILDESGQVLAYSARATPAEKRAFLKLFLRDVLANLELERQRPGRLKHLHVTFGKINYLFSYQTLLYDNQRYYVVLHHDTGYLIREVLPGLFNSEQGKGLYNVVDENNHRVYGVDLTHAGDYLVGRRFPTTLYTWRLQIAPKQGPLLEEKRSVRKVNEVGLVGLSFLVVIAGVIFLLYAAHEERRLNRLKSDFIANVSHELKTPLSAIRMFSEMLLTNRVRSEQKRQDYLEMICRESERLSNLIENVLDFAALERGKQRFTFSEQDVRPLVEKAIDTFRYRMEHEGTEVELETKGEPAKVRMDEPTLLLAIVNLLDNAVKYGEGSKVCVGIDYGATEVTISVRDFGKGIPPDDIKRIFDRFHRSSRDAAMPGSGIGLSLVKQIVLAHDGRVWAENAWSGGACVSLALPKVLANTSQEPRNLLA